MLSLRNHVFITLIINLTTKNKSDLVLEVYLMSRRILGSIFHTFVTNLMNWSTLCTSLLKIDYWTYISVDLYLHDDYFILHKHLKGHIAIDYKKKYLFVFPYVLYSSCGMFIWNHLIYSSRIQMYKFTCYFWKKILENVSFPMNIFLYFLILS